MTARAGVLGALRARVAAIETSSKPGRVLPLGDPRLDLNLPGGGLPLGRWHELVGEGLEAEDPAAVTGFAARLAAALSARDAETGGGETVWVLRRGDLYAPGLAGLGLDPARLLFVTVRRDADALAAAEDALRAKELILQRLQTDPAYVEKVIRMNLHYAKPDELIFRFDE